VDWDGWPWHFGTVALWECVSCVLCALDALCVLAFICLPSLPVCLFAFYFLLIAELARVTFLQYMRR